MENVETIVSFNSENGTKVPKHKSSVSQERR